MRNPRLTIIIPTMNRPDFVIRLLEYYAEAGFEHRIAIGDSSNAANVELTRAAIARIGGRLDVQYHEYPGLSCHSAQQALIASADTPYIVSLPDDDFLAPSGLNRCMDFLDVNHDYVAAHGWGILLRRHPGAPAGVVLNYYPQPVVEAETPEQRVLDQLGLCLVTVFSVHRTEAFRTMWATEIADYGFGEILPCCLSAVLGKIKQLDCFYLVREVHDRRYLSPDVFDWLTRESWHASFSVFSRTLARELSARAGITEQESTAIVKRGFWHYLAKAIPSHFPTLPQPPKPPPRARLAARRVLRAAPFLRRFAVPLVLSYRRIRHGGPDLVRMQLNLPALLRPGTRHHDEFMPILRAVVDAPAD